MTPPEIEKAIKTISLIVDTREQPTRQSKHRLESVGFPIVRQALNFGDYSAFVTADDKTISLENKAVIERKMSLEELSSCFTQQRARFEREFERAKAAGAKTYLLVENSSIDMILRHQYSTQFHPNAYIASLMAWLTRYNCQIVFCSSINSGRMIREILLREMKEFLEGVEP